MPPQDEHASSAVTSSAEAATDTRASDEEQRNAKIHERMVNLVAEHHIASVKKVRQQFEETA